MRARTARTILGVVCLAACGLCQTNGVGGWGESPCIDLPEVVGLRSGGTNVVLLLALPWVAARGADTTKDRVEFFLRALKPSQRFTVACFAETTALWTNRFVTADEAMESHALSFLQSAWSSPAVLPSRPVVSRLDRALSAVVPLKPDAIILLGTGEEYGVSLAQPEAATARWQASDCISFLTNSWRTCHGEGLPKDFRFNCVAFTPDKDGNTFCTGVARAFKGSYRLIRRSQSTDQLGPKAPSRGSSM